MRSALAYKEDEYDDAEPLYPRPTNKTALSTNHRGMPFTVVGEPANQEIINSNSYAVAEPETKIVQNTTPGSRKALPTIEASKPRQWKSGTLSGVTAPSFFTKVNVNEVDFEAVEPLENDRNRDWQVHSHHDSFAGAPVLPSYRNTLRPRRSSRSIERPLKSEPRENFDIENQIEVRQPSSRRVRRDFQQIDAEVAVDQVQSYITPPPIPNFGNPKYEEKYTEKSKAFDWLNALNNGLIQNKKQGLIILFSVLVVVLMMQSLNKPTRQVQIVDFDTKAVALSSSQQSTQNPVSTSNGDNVVGQPSINPQQINNVLAQYHSPAVGVGQTMYDLGKKYGIDPAFALAFFVHESSAGTKGVATVTKSIGNIRVTPGYDEYQGFRKYPTWEAGIEDWFKLIKNLYVDGWHLTTLQSIIPKYAPSADHNDPIAYINQVHNLVASWRGNN